MIFPVVIAKLLYWVFTHLLAKPCRRLLRKMTTDGFVLRSPSLRSASQSPLPFPSVSKLVPGDLRDSGATFVSDIDGGLLKTRSFFPYFMLVAFEGGSPIRAFVLLLSWPFSCLLNDEMQLRVTIFITFCGIKVKRMNTVARAVLPKFYLDNLHMKIFNVLASCESSIVVTSIPVVMVDHFLKRFLEVETVIGTELHTYGSYYTGFPTPAGLLVKHKALQNHLNAASPNIGVGNSLRHSHLSFLSICKEAYLVTLEDLKAGISNPNVTQNMKHPKPLVFHDGRLAFLPTPSAAMAMFLWIPLGVVLAIFRISIGVFLPLKTAMALGVWSGVDVRVRGFENLLKPSSTKGVLFVCNHRTLMDPVLLSTSIGRPLSAVTYSLSKVSEIISPIKTVRMTRDRKTDAETMQRMLKEGDLVVCPEGTTCREPFLLRFSSLFAEISDDILPVAINTSVDMFYGTTASGWKCLDSVFFMMNPRPGYYIKIMEKLPKELTCGGGKTSHEVANYLQRRVADVLGFQCTNLTRKDKYSMLTGN